jgi:peptidoglycan/LPS O-acetylase OafA/YrhL
MLWVIIGHQYSLTIVDSSNLLTIDDKMYTWYMLFIEAGILAVDTFFFIGGFLVAYSILK